jgi:hypothetical protein
MTHNPLHDKIRQIVEPKFREIAHPAKGTVLAYSHEHRYAKVEINNQWEPGTTILEFVPVYSPAGMHAPGLHPGDEVWVTFTGGKIGMPMIMAQADRDYNANTRERKLKHTTKGAYVADRLGKRKVGKY